MANVTPTTTKKVDLKELIRSEYKKCAMNPQYFIRKYVYIQHPVKGRMLFSLYDYQDKCIDEFQEHQYNIVLKGRQIGLSTAVAAYALWMMLFYKDKNVLVIATKQETAKNLVTKVRFAYENLPVWLQVPCEEKNKLSIRFKNGSQIKATTAAADSSRSESLSLAIFDEVAFIRNAEEIWTAALPTLSSGGRAVLISTPNGVQGFFHKKYTEAEQEISTIRESSDGEEEVVVFNAIKLDWRVHPERDDAWYKRTIAAIGPIKFRQEYEAEFLGSGNTVIDEDLIKFYEDTTVKDPIEKAGFDGNIWVWEKPSYTREYILCLPEGEKVLTQRGSVAVEDVRYGDSLIDMNGNSTSIEDFKRKEYDGDVYRFTVSNTFRTTAFTDEHPIYVSSSTLKRNYNRNHPVYRFNERYWDHDFKFTDAKYVNVGDWIQYPNIYRGKELSDGEILSKFSKYSDITRVDFRVDDTVILSTEFWWYVGMWLAEGWVQTDKQHGFKTCFTSHNRNETDIANRISKLANDLFGRSNVITPNKNRAMYCQFNSKQVGMFLSDNFGRYAGGKYISEWVKYLPMTYKLALIEGYLQGDGCVYEESHGRNGYHACFVSISLELLEGIQDILFSLGIISSLKRLRHEKYDTVNGDILYHHKETYQLSLAMYDTNELMKLLQWNDKVVNLKNNRIISNCYLSKDLKWIYFQVKNIEKCPYKGIVYNFTTESRTFLCENITTHNCADPARGDGSDFSAFQIFDLETCAQVAEYKGKVETTDFAHMLIEWSTRYNDALLVVERENVGWAVLQVIINRGYKNLFYMSKDRQVVEVERNINNRYYAEEKKMVPGFSTSVRTRPLIISKLDTYMRSVLPSMIGEWDGQVDLEANPFAIIIRSKRLIEELKVFIWENGKAQAASGYNDDTVLSTCIALWVRDTSLKLYQEGTHLTKAAIEGFKRSEYESEGVYTTSHIGYDPYSVNIGNSSTNEGQEDIRWLLG